MISASFIKSDIAKDRHHITLKLKRYNTRATVCTSVTNVYRLVKET